MKIAVIGGGPAGLRAAEVAAEAGADVTLFDAKRSVGRKFLVAGRGGLNLTHAEPRERFLTRYSGPGLPQPAWSAMITEFDADALRAWSDSLGIETFAASTGRVYPREMKAAPLLRRWIERLRSLGVQFMMNHRWTGLGRSAPGGPFQLDFTMEDSDVSLPAEAVILALGGASWPDTGSNGQWQLTLEKLGIPIAPLEAANCGWEVPGVFWTPGFLAAAEGKPLKNIAVRCGGRTATGELMIARYGLEGGALYQIGAALRDEARTHGEARLFIDLKPGSDAASLLKRLGPLKKNWLEEARKRWRLSEAAFALLKLREPFSSGEALVAATKAFELPLLRPRPIAEAISSAGGVRWEGITEELMIRTHPGLFVAGEMIDWEAPTGGYLMQGCFASGTKAARSAVEFLKGRQKN